MAALSIKVQINDADGRVIETDHAYGNTPGAAKAAAEALGRQMEQEHPGGTVVKGRVSR